VLASDGTYFGWLDHVRYARHADHPDEIIVRGRRLLARRRRVLPFSAVAEVSLRAHARAREGRLCLEGQPPLAMVVMVGLVPGPRAHARRGAHPPRNCHR